MAATSATKTHSLTRNKPPDWSDWNGEKFLHLVPHFLRIVEGVGNVWCGTKTGRC